jgi:hypothetical protein
MPEQQPVQLVTAVIFDPDARVLLAESKNYGFELPGTRIKDGDALVSLRASLHDKLGINVLPDEEHMPFLSEVNVSLGGVSFYAQIRRITEYKGSIAETEGSGYRQILWVNPLKHQLGRIGLSPVAESFRKIVSEDPGLLL